MRVTIVRRYDFEAAHRLPFVPDGHKCKTMHGHSYALDVHVTGDVQEAGPEVGMVVDFGVVDEVARSLVRSLDHRPLNEVHPNPTVENMAPWVHRCLVNGLPNGLQVRVHFHEGPRSTCIYPSYEVPGGT